MMIKAKIYHQDDTWIWTLDCFSLLFSGKSIYIAIRLRIFRTPLSSPFVIILQMRCLFLRKSDVVLSQTRGQMTEVLFSCQNTHQLAPTCQALIILLILVSIASTSGGVLSNRCTFQHRKLNVLDHFCQICAFCRKCMHFLCTFHDLLMWWCTKIDNYEVCRQA